VSVSYQLQFFIFWELREKNWWIDVVFENWKIGFFHKLRMKNSKVENSKKNENCEILEFFS
jgi:hypothetical protein